MSDVGDQTSSPKAEEAIIGLVDCAKCGHSNPATTRYCGNCGNDLSKAQSGRGEAQATSKKGILARLFGRTKRAA